MTNDYTRPLLLASATTDLDGDLLSHLQRQTVVVSRDGDSEGCVRACRVLLTVLRRLPIALVLDGVDVPENERNAVKSAVVAIDPTRPLRIEEEPPDDAFRIHVGTNGQPGVLRVVPSRHGAHVIRDARGIDAVDASALGSCIAAALAAGEVFKVVASVRSDRRADPAHVAFCPVTLSDRPEDAPPLRLPFEFHGALLGLGAIGTATAMILRELGTRGEIDLVDRQRFGLENVSTYSLGGTKEANGGVWKTQLAERGLSFASCRRFDMDLAEYVELVQRGGTRAPRIVLCGLDSVEARHEAQRLWPDMLIDGATGDTMVGLHVVEGCGRPCMMCFLEPRSAPSSYVRLAEMTGIPIARLREGDEVLTEADVVGISEAHRAVVAPHLGKQICGLAQAVGLTDIPSGAFHPSVAFVSLHAACLVVGRLLAKSLDVAPKPNFVQYDALIGPAGKTVETRKGRDGCYCTTREETIAVVRRNRFE